MDDYLSKRACRICTAIIVCLVGYLIWEVVTDQGFFHWFNALQISWFVNWYSGKFTIAIEVLAIVLISLGGGLLHDWITRRGRFASGPEYTHYDRDDYRLG
jgi:hypothetical protein